MEIEWDDQSLKSQFLNNLKPELRAEIRKLLAIASAGEEEGEEGDIERQMSLEKFISMACKFDNAIYLAEEEQKGAHKKLDTVQGRAGTTSVLTEEKDRRSKEGLCIKCGKGKHRFALCK